MFSLNRIVTYKLLMKNFGMSPVFIIEHSNIASTWDIKCVFYGILKLKNYSIVFQDPFYGKNSSCTYNV